MDDTRLAALLAKKRSPLKAGLVEAVMAQAVSEADKVQRIEMIDLLPDAPPPAPPARREPSARAPAPRSERPLPAKPVDPPPLVDPDLDEPDRVEHRRRHLGRPPERGGFWRYFFRERGRMTEWGVRTSTLVKGTFPFTLKLSPEALQLLTYALRGEILPVLEQNLPKILPRIWKTFEKPEYNLLAALKPLCQALSAVPAPGPRGPVPAQWDPVLPALMVFWTGNGLERRVKDLWGTACVQLGLGDTVRLGGQDSLRTLLEPRPDRVALPDALRALLLLRTRRMVEWDELLPREGGEYFARDSFDCPREVQAEIDRAVEALRRQLEPVDRDFIEVRRIRYFLPSENLLDEFTGGADRSDRSAWCLKFLDRAEALRPLLSGTVALRGEGRTTLFRDIAISSALTRLGVLHTQLTGEQSRDPEIPAAVARVITNLGKLVVIQIRDRSLAAEPLVRSARPTEVADPLPQELSVLEKPEEWAGLTVIDALVRAARVCLLAGRFLGDTSLEAALEKEEPLTARAREILTQLTRLAKPGDIADVVEAWRPHLEGA